MIHSLGTSYFWKQIYTFLAYLQFFFRRYHNPSPDNRDNRNPYPKQWWILTLLGRYIRNARTYKLLHWISYLHQYNHQKGRMYREMWRCHMNRMINMFWNIPKEISWGLSGPVAYKSYHFVSIRNRFPLKLYVYIKNIVLHNIMCETNWIVIVIRTQFYTLFCGKSCTKDRNGPFRPGAIIVLNLMTWQRC